MCNSGIVRNPMAWSLRGLQHISLRLFRQKKNYINWQAFNQIRRMLCFTSRLTALLAHWCRSGRIKKIFMHFDLKRKRANLQCNLYAYTSWTLFKDKTFSYQEREPICYRARNVFIPLQHHANVQYAQNMYCYIEHFNFPLTNRNRKELQN